MAPGRLFFPSNVLGSQLPVTLTMHKRQKKPDPTLGESRAVGIPPIGAFTLAPTIMPMDLMCTGILAGERGKAAIEGIHTTHDSTGEGSDCY